MFAHPSTASPFSFEESSLELASGIMTWGDDNKRRFFDVYVGRKDRCHQYIATTSSSNLHLSSCLDKERLVALYTRLGYDFDIEKWLKALKKFDSLSVEVRMIVDTKSSRAEKDHDWSRPFPFIYVRDVKKGVFSTSDVFLSSSSSLSSTSA